MQTTDSATDGDLRDAIRNFILTEVLETPEADLDDDAPLISDGLMNSLSTLKLVAFLEEKFGVVPAAHEVSVKYLDSVGQIADFVDEKRGA